VAIIDPAATAAIIVPPPVRAFIPAATEPIIAPPPLRLPVATAAIIVPPPPAAIVFPPPPLRTIIAAATAAIVLRPLRAVIPRLPAATAGIVLPPPANGGFRSARAVILQAVLSHRERGLGKLACADLSQGMAMNDENDVEYLTFS